MDARDVAEAGLAALALPGQVLVVMEEGMVRVDVTAVADGRAATVRAAGAGREELARAGKQAALHARRMRALPAPPLAEPHGLLAPDRPGLGDETAAIAVASSTGLRSFEVRRWRRAPPGGQESSNRCSDPDKSTFAPRERVVLGPEAVAALLVAVRHRFGVDAALGTDPVGTRILGAGLGLVDDAADPRGIPQAFDAEGVPRQRVTLVRDGIAVGTVRDSAAGASTGHAARPLTLAPVAEQLVLTGGSYADLDALCRAAENGVLIPRLSRDAEGWHAPGAVVLRDGVATTSPTAGTLNLDPAALLLAAEDASTQAECVPIPGQTPGGPGSVLTGGLLTTLESGA